MILLVVANHERCRLEEGIRRDGERGPVGNIENRSGNFKVESINCVSIISISDITKAIIFKY